MKGRMKRLHLTEELLQALLFKYADKEILIHNGAFDHTTNTVVLYISHPDFEPIEEGGEIPQAEVETDSEVWRRPVIRIR